MTDTVDSAKRSWTMAQVHSRDTAPELAVRRALHAAGFRFRLKRDDLPGRPDLVLPRFRLVVFVHGCFWHWHGCRRSRMPATNTEYWTAKLARNTQRDRTVQAELERLGWRWRVIWECERSAGITNLVNELAEERAQARAN